MEKVTTNPVEREKLREKGQFFTPEWVTKAMSAFILENAPSRVFEPGFGTGAFYVGMEQAAKVMGLKMPEYEGCETDETAITRSEANGVPQNVRRLGIQERDFFDFPNEDAYDAILGNPPYIRHHRLTRKQKKELATMVKEITGSKIDKRAGYHVFFLIKSLAMLKTGGRLSFILPADVAEGKYSTKLWEWISTNYRLHSVVTFTPDATPFPGVDTNPIILNISKRDPDEEFDWIACDSTDDKLFKHFSNAEKVSDLKVAKRSLEEGLHTGLSRPETDLGEEGVDYKPFSEFAFCIRGIATGANEFFWFTKEGVDNFGLSKKEEEKYIKRCIGRTREVQTDRLTTDYLKELDEQGKKTYLLSIGNEEPEDLPAALQDHIKEGEAQELHERSLISQRKPWYKMETRKPPFLFFSYLGRRKNRFILNEAKALTLTGFLCIYPDYKNAEHEHDEFEEALFKSLNHPKTIGYLSLVGKSYGNGAIKVEPRQLDKLPILAEVAKETGLDNWWGD